MDTHETVSSSDNNRFQFILENMGDLVWSVDIDLHFIYISPSVKEILGYSPEEIMEKTLADIFLPESFKQFKENILWEKALNQDGWHVMEIELKRKDNTTLKTEVKLSLIHHKKSGLFEILGACMNTSKEGGKTKNSKKH